MIADTLKKLPYLYSSRVTAESKTIHNTPAPSSHLLKLGCLLFLTGSWNSTTLTQHCTEGTKEGKLYPLLLKLVKLQKSPSGQSVSTNFDANCRLSGTCCLQGKSYVWKYTAFWVKNVKKAIQVLNYWSDVREI